MLVTYPALFYYDDTETVPFYIVFPDIEGTGTQGKDINEAMVNASDYLAIHIADYIESGQDVPSVSSITDLSLEGNKPFDDLEYNKEKSFISLVNVDVTEYLGQKELIKKTLNIPKWADKIGKEMGLNFSQVLTEAIANKKVNIN